MNKHIGSDFSDFLAEDGIKEEITSQLYKDNTLLKNALKKIREINWGDWKSDKDTRRIVDEVLLLVKD